MAKIAFILKSFIGDAVMTEPTLRAIDSAGDEAVLLANPIVSEVLGRPVITTCPQRGWQALFAMSRALRTIRPDAAVMVNRSFRSALAARLAGIPTRIGHDTEGRGFLLTHRIPYDKTASEAVCYARLLGPLGIAVPDAHPNLPCDGDLEGIVVTRRMVAIQPGARYVEKQLPLAHSLEIARNFAAQGYGIILVGGIAERAIADRFLNAWNADAQDTVGRLTITEMKRLFRLAGCAIGADTGLMHLAAGVGCPSVTVFGPQPASKWGHWYTPHQVIESEGGIIAQIPVERICLAAEAALAAGHPRASEMSSAPSSSF